MNQRRWKKCLRPALAALLSAMTAGAQTLPPQTQPVPAQPTTAQTAASGASVGPAHTAVVSIAPAKPVKLPTTGERRRAARMFLQSSKLFTGGRFEEAMRGYEKASKLDPTNADYSLAALVARSHAVTALIQAAAKQRNRGDAAAARASLAHALVLDPKSTQVAEHLNELSDDQLLGRPNSLYEQDAATIGAAVGLVARASTHSFHLRADQRQIIQQVFKAYGVDVTLDESIRPTPVRFDVDDASYQQATQALALVTSTFYVSLDAHRVLAARDTHENRLQFSRQNEETIYLNGLNEVEMTEVSTLAKNIFQLQSAGMDPTAGTITLRAPEVTLTAFNATLRELLGGHGQVMLDVRLIQIAHTSERNTGIQPPQTMTAFNVYAEEQSIMSANAALVQQIISSGLAAPGDTLGILGILLASGQISSSLFSNGVALFGGGITQSALAPAGTTANFNLTSSDTRELDEIQLRLSDGEAGTVRLGERYPIQTSSFSTQSLGTSGLAGLAAAGTSSALTSLLASYAGSGVNIPQIEYEDLGLTLKATPAVMHNSEVALTIDFKIEALSGSFANGNPVLNNRAYSGVTTLKLGEAIVIASELNKTESNAIDGAPGISEIPGMNDLTGNDSQKSNATLLIIVTAHVLRENKASGHSPVMRIEKNQTLQ